MPQKTALITGASSGIGAAFATALAKSGHDLILVARSEAKLEQLAVALKVAHQCKVAVIPADLTEPDAASVLKAEVTRRRLQVEVLVNNAGFGSGGEFVDTDAQRNAEMISLNAAAVVALSHAFLPAMLKKKSGAIINVASTSAFQPLPYLALYAATKAFVLSFSEALSGEVKAQGVKVLALCPGPVDTPFFEATGKPEMKNMVPKPMMMDADAVVTAALQGLKQGKAVVVPGWPNKLTSFMPRLLPRRLMTAASGKLMKH